jgi:cyclic pyranopterin phosphate synthase
MSKLTHLDEKGAAHMVDVSAKAATEREATAEATISLARDAFEAVMTGNAPKGDVLAAARIAGIMAAKKTSELIPLCHPLAISKAALEFEPQSGSNAIRILATVKTTGQTGVEMEALTAASVAALTIYDMIKAVDKSAEISAIRLLAKSGGKSGEYRAPGKIEPFRPAVQPASRRQPQTLMGEVSAPRTRVAANIAAQRDAFRAFMTSRGLRATEWAKRAGVSSGSVLSFLTGKTNGLASDVAEKLARAANVRAEDMFR